MAFALHQTSNDCTVTMILEGLHLEKYQLLFSKKGLPFDSFVNLNEEDLKYLGITDEKDLKTLVDGLRPFHNIYTKDIEFNEQLNGDTIIGNTVHQLRTIYAVLSNMKRRINKLPLPNNTLIDSTTPVTSAILQFLTAAKDQVDSIKSDFIKAAPPEKTNKIKTKFLVRRIVFFGAIGLLIFQGFRSLRTRMMPPVL